MTPYKHALDKFIESEEFQKMRDRTTIDRTSNVYLENRLKMAFEAGWNAKEDADKASHERAIDMSFGG